MKFERFILKFKSTIKKYPAFVGLFFKPVSVKSVLVGLL